MIEISEYYTTNKGKLKFLCDDKEINNRPAWIKVLESDQPIKFLKVNTESGRFYYTSFVENYYLTVRHMLLFCAFRLRCIHVLHMPQYTIRRGCRRSRLPHRAPAAAQSGRRAAPDASLRRLPASKMTPNWLLLRLLCRF